MKLFVHNTLTRKKEEFVPLDPSRVRMYVCGPTVYDFAHIGNARPVVVFDTLHRVLKRIYANVEYARNITDIDDRIIARAAESGRPIDAITTETTRAYREDMAAIGAASPDHEPVCTQTVPEMVAMIATLVEKGHAYAAEGHVLFHVPSYADYGRLSGRSRDDQIAGARVEVAPYKRDPADFVLWKPSTPDQPGWDSPWGRGRPGWHIECSAMSETLFGKTFDIHGGGQDLIFPHHENEIAQSVCAHDGVQFVKYWMHNGFVIVNGEKMSKSLGNFYTVRDLLNRGERGEAIRLLLLKTHYRAPLDFTDEGLKQAKAELDRWYRAYAHAEEGGEHEIELDVSEPSAFDALLDDLNTPLAISRLHALADKMLAVSPAEAATHLVVFRQEASLLGLLSSTPSYWFKGPVGEDTAWIEDAIQARLAARKAKNFTEADRIRDDLKAKGVILEDGPKGTSWKRAG
ncbi:MAG: cysteine--tRNA ligase [Tagaea sp.]|nr:cysteine--tRNA ligase [Tagaea sp.]